MLVSSQFIKPIYICSAFESMTNWFQNGILTSFLFCCGKDLLELKFLQYQQINFPASKMKSLWEIFHFESLCWTDEIAPMSVDGSRFLMLCCENKSTQFLLLLLLLLFRNEPTQYFIKSFTYAHMTLCRKNKKANTDSCFKCEWRSHNFVF